MEYPKLRIVDAFLTQVSGQEVVCLRDPFNYTEQMLLISPNIFFIVSLFDGKHSIVDIQSEYAQKYGSILLSEDVQKIINEIDSYLFLDNVRFREFRRKIVEEFRKQPIRFATHAGTAYELEAEGLQAQLDGYYYKDVNLLLKPTKPVPAKKEEQGSRVLLKGIIAPHIDIKRGGQCFAYAYNEIKMYADADIFIILGTGHYPANNFFALTQKAFETPFGILETDKDFLSLLCKNSGKTLFEDEFIHKSEHSVEFQVLFLQHILDGTKNGIKIVPILCSSFHELLTKGISPLEKPQISDFILSLKEAIATVGKKICIIASVDLAHVGLRFGDVHPQTPEGLEALSIKDREMLKFVENIDPEGFYHYIKEEDDKRRICGLPAIYTFLNIVDANKCRLLRYEQCNDDKTGSTVTFASMAFYSEK